MLKGPSENTVLNEDAVNALHTDSMLTCVLFTLYIS